VESVRDKNNAHMILAEKTIKEKLGRLKRKWSDIIKIGWQDGG
jgi:hypothetical protein